MVRISRAFALGGTVAAVAAALTVAGAGPVSAAPAAPGVSVRAGHAVLTPAAGGGYAGQLAVRIRATGADAAGVAVTIGQPAGVRFAGERDGQLHTCVPSGPRALECYLPVTIAAGTEHTVNVLFTSLAAPQRRTRFSEEAAVTVAGSTARFRARLAGTGPGVAPDVYRPATVPDMAVQAGPATFVDNGDGSWTGRMEVTTGAATDAEHNEIGAAISGLPAGSAYRVEGQPIGCFDPTWPCRLDPVAQGARKTATIVIWSPEPPVAGAQLGITVTAMLALQPLADANAADNAATSTVVVN